jgi:hypothetical protein
LEKRKKNYDKRKEERLDNGGMTYEDDIKRERNKVVDNFLRAKDEQLKN